MLRNKKNSINLSCLYCEKCHAFGALISTEARISTDVWDKQFFKYACLEDIKNTVNWLVKSDRSLEKDAPLSFFP